METTDTDAAAAPQRLRPNLTPGVAAGLHSARELCPPDAAVSELKRRNYARYVVSLLEQGTIARNTPLELSVEMANSCNLNCKFCMLHGKPDRSHGPRGLMPASVIEKVARFFPGAAFTCLHGHGEPFMNPALVSVATEARRQGVFVEFYTNGRMLTEERAKRLVDAQVTRIFVSISTADSRLYEHLYERGRFDVLCRNLELIHAEKQRRGTRWPEIHFNAIAFRSTVPRFVELVDFAGRHGVSGIDLQPMVVYRHLGDVQLEALAYDASEHEPILQAAEERARTHGMSLFLESFRHSCPRAADDEFETERLTPEAEGLRLEKLCPLVYRTMYVTAGGETKPCAFASKDPALSLGNLNEQSLEEIWNGPRYQELRRAHLEGRVHPICRRCLRLNLAPPKDSAADWLRHNGHVVYEYGRAVRALTRANACVAAARAELEATLRGTNPRGSRLAALATFKVLAPAIVHLESEIAVASVWLPGLEGSDARVSTLGAFTRELVAVLECNSPPPSDTDIRETLVETCLPLLDAWPEIASRFVEDFHAAHVRLADCASELG